MESIKKNTTINFEMVEEALNPLKVETKIVDSRDTENKKAINIRSYKFLKGHTFKYVITVSNEYSEDVRNIILKENLPVSVTIHSNDVLIEDITAKENQRLKLPFGVDENIFSINFRSLSKNQAVRIIIPFTINY